MFPAFLVVERGVTLKQWSKGRRSVFDVIAMVESVARLVDSLHTAGYVHRDLKVCTKWLPTTHDHARIEMLQLLADTCRCVEVHGPE